MRRLAAIFLVISLAAAAPAAAKVARTPVRLKAPSAANATVAGFELDLVRATRARTARALAAALPKSVSVYAVVGRQKRSDRVRGVLVAVNRAPSVRTTPQRRSRRRLTVNLSHAKAPSGFRLRFKLRQVANVLSRHRSFSCASYFKSSDLAHAQKLAGRRLPNITVATVIQAACSAAKGAKPFATLGEFRAALNAPSGSLQFAASATVPGGVDGSATFNYPVKAFAVASDSKHQFTSCAFGAGTCTVSPTTTVFALSAPAAAGTPLSFSLGVTPAATPGLPFRFFGFDTAGRRHGPLLTSGPQ